MKLDVDMTAKKISTIRLSFGSFVKRLGASGFDDGFVVKVVFGICGQIIKKVEGMDELTFQMANIIRRETNDNSGVDPGKPGQIDESHR